MIVASRILARWLVLIVVATVSSALIAVDLRWHQDYRLYDLRSKTGFTTWVSSSCAAGASAAMSFVESKLQPESNAAEQTAQQDTLACLRATRKPSCLPGAICSANSPEQSACPACRPDYFANPPPRDELRRHYRFLRDATARWRGVQQHTYGSHSGPWLENHFLRNFFWRGFDYWYPLVPLFIQATDALFLGKDVAASRSLEEFFSGRPSGTAGPGNAAAAAAAGIDQAGEPMGGSPLRDDVIYVLVVQHDMGALAVVPDPFLWRNTIVLSAGGWGNVPLPLMTGGGCMQQPVYHSPASSDASTADAARAALLRSHLLSFVGRLSYRDVSNHGGISARIMDWRQELMDQLAAALCFAEEAAENSSAAAAAASDADAGAQSAAPAATAPRSIGFTNEELLALGNDAFAASQRPVPPSTAPQLLSPEDMARLRGGSSTISGRDISVRCGLHLQQWRRNDAWKRVTADSALVLATRGVGATSFRLYESLAAGRVPVYVWRDLLWLPYGNAEASLWGPEGIAVVTEGSSAAAALVEGLPQLLRPRSAGELQGRPDAIAAAAAAAGGAAAALDAAAVDASSGSAAPVVASLESIVLQAAARGQAAARDTTKGTPTSQHSSSSVNSAKATSVSTPLAYAIPPSSKLAEMEARLRRLHDRYFSYDALMVHIHAFLKAPHASELQCEPKPTVVYMP